MIFVKPTKIKLFRLRGRDTDAKIVNKAPALKIIPAPQIYNLYNKSIFFYVRVQACYQALELQNSRALFGVANILYIILIYMQYNV